MLASQENINKAHALYSKGWHLQVKVPSVTLCCSCPPLVILSSVVQWPDLVLGSFHMALSFSSSESSPI